MGPLHIVYNAPDSVYPFKPTPLCVAARYVDLKMCNYLVENGADVTITEKDGMRPYSIAVEKGDEEMKDMCDFSEIINDMPLYMQKINEGEYE